MILHETNKYKSLRKNENIQHAFQLRLRHGTISEKVKKVRCTSSRKSNAQRGTIAFSSPTIGNYHLEF